MKKHLLLVFALVAFVGFNHNYSVAQTNNVLVEYVTGTWCGWCPCGHTILESIETSFPNTTILAYHGGSGDPWLSLSQPMRLLLWGPSASYPTGIIGRNSGIVSRGAWYSYVSSQQTNQPGVSIQLNNKLYDGGSRTVTGSVRVTALTPLNGEYYINFVLTENNIVYPQNYYAGCGTAGYHNDYVHNHVVKALLNGAAGTLIEDIPDTWNSGSFVDVPLNVVIPNDVVAENSKINIFVYKNEAPLTSMGTIQQSKVEDLMSLTGISNQNGVADKYSLGQNYPNPFNPTTNITFSIPEDQFASLKIYNLMGQEVATYLEGFTKAGLYKAEVDGSKLSSGIYFYTLKTDNFVETKKMMLVK